MKKILVCLAVAWPIAAIGTAAAQDGERERPRRDGEMRARMIEEFDADGDGQLSDEERQTAREAMRERRGDRPGRGGEGRGGQGRPAPIDPDQVFNEFDADKDGQLSRDEFAAYMESRRGPRGPRDGRGGGPRAAGERRGPRDRGPEPEQADAPAGDEAGAPRRRGPRGEGPSAGEGRGPRGGFDPNRMFDRFDGDGDDRLTRDEFSRLADRLRQAREQMGERGRGRGPRDGFGGPGRGGTRGERPARPQRPDAAPAAESAAADDGSA